MLVPNITLIAPTTVRLSWSFGNARKYVTDPWGFRIVYKASNGNDANSVLIKNNHTAVNISRLRSNTYYSFWMMTVSTNGFGVTSKVVNATTLSQGNVTFVYVKTAWPGTSAASFLWGIFLAVYSEMFWLRVLLCLFSILFLVNDIPLLLLIPLCIVAEHLL